MSDTSVSIVFYKPSKEQVIKVVKSCLMSTCLGKLFIIDNSPKNEVLSYLESSNVIEYLHFPDNLGFGKGHNVAFEKSIKLGFEYHAIVNPDIYFDDNVFEYLTTYLEDHKNVGAIMPKVLYPDGNIQRLCKLFPSPLNLLFRRFIPFKSLKKKMDFRYEMHFFDYNTVADIPLLSGCFLVIRTEVFKAGCFFDDRYFMYLEDYDLCRTIRKSGWGLIYNPNVKVFHEFEKGSHKNMKLLKYHILSAIRYFNKWGWIIDKERKKINQKYK